MSPESGKRRIDAREGKILRMLTEGNKRESVPTPSILTSLSRAGFKLFPAPHGIVLLRIRLPKT